MGLDWMGEAKVVEVLGLKEEEGEEDKAGGIFLD